MNYSCPKCERFAVVKVSSVYYKIVVLLLKSVFENPVVVPTVVVEHARNPFGVVDKRVAVTLECPDNIVAASFAIVYGILLVPGEQGGESPHVCSTGGVVAAAGLNQAGIVGENQVGLQKASRTMSAAFKSNIQVELSTGDIAASMIPYLVSIRSRPVGIAGIAATDTPKAIVCRS